MEHVRMTRGLLAACLAALLLVGSVLPTAAIEPTWTPSAAYRASTYYQNLRAIPETGDQAFDTVSVALSQIGYHEASSTSGLGGTTAGSGNYTEYNMAFGKVSGTYSYAWCAAFVSWCLMQSGARESAAGLFASCTLWVDALREQGQYRTRSSGYTPKAGDLIFFRSAGVSRASDHVGLVRYVKGGRVYTVEGNSSDAVSLRSYALGDTYIVGYGLPDYGGTSVNVDRQKAEDSAAGLYAVTYDFLNVRAGPAASAAKRGTLASGAVITVLSVKNGWGEILYENKKAYVSLEYADFVAPTRHRVRYVSEGRELYVNSVWSTDTVRVATLVPEREGYTFLHWSDGGEGILTAGDALVARDLTLTAVFREIPVPEIPPEDDTPADGTENEGENGETEDVLPPEMDAPPVVLPPDEVPDGIPDITDTTDVAARHAGVVSGVLAATLSGVWALRKRKEE